MAAYDSARRITKASANALSPSVNARAPASATRSARARPIRPGCSPCRTRPARTRDRRCEQRVAAARRRPLRLGALRDVITNFDLISASRSFRVAQAENLRALLVEEELLASLTPEFLNLKFQQQERLATAREQELASLRNFDAAIASLYRAMGTGLEMHQIDLEVVPNPAAADALVTSGWIGDGEDH